MSRWLNLSSVAVFLLYAALYQPAAQVNEFVADANLQRVVRASGCVFAGRVLAVEYVSPRAPDEVGTVRVTFKVEQGIRGTRNGSTVTIREWAGLWSAGERYRVGEQLVLFFYPRSKLGLTSLVGGQWGRYTLDRSGRVILPTIGDQPNSPALPAPRPTRSIPLRTFIHGIRVAEAQEK